MENVPAASPDFLRPVAEWIARSLEMGGIAIIVLGLVGATLVFLFRLRLRGELSNAYHAYRRDLGRAILLGLEFLVAGDIIATVAVEPTYANVGVLGLIVLIRTFLSFSLEVEINGRWPWQTSAREDESTHDSR